MRYTCLSIAALCGCLLFFSAPVLAQLPAFPTAEGAGKFTTGGRGSASAAPKIFEVTTLVDDINSSTTPGTFRYACTNSTATNRIIVFRVSGTIHLYQTLSLNKANTTIAGQTAPGEGICIADYPVYIGANNMIIRYLRFRLGDKSQLKTTPAGCGLPVPPFTNNPSCVPTATGANPSGADDAFGDNGSGRQNIIIDHCTAGWSDDESLTIYKGDNVTVQWCMISEPLNYSYHVESGDNDYEQHAYGGIWGGAHATFHHNLIAHIKGRGPRFDGTRNIASENVDFRNNVIYDWIDYNTNGGEGGNYNVVNNYYKWGPSTLTTSTAGVNRRSMILNPYKQTTSTAIPYGKYYLVGNYCDNDPVITADNWRGAAFNNGSFADSIASKVDVPFAAIDINTQSAQEAYTSVLVKAGCVLPHRDTLDQRIVADVMNRTGRVIDVQGGYAHGTPYATSQSAWPALASGTAPTDSDHDGMPDAWENARGLNPNNATDANGYVSANGYPNIENYLNGDSVVATGVVNTCVGTKTIVATASGGWINAADTASSSFFSSSYISSADSTNLIASVLDNGAYGGFNVSYYTSNTLRYDAYNHPYLNRNVTVIPTNPAAITSPVTVRLYFTKAEYDALKAADASIVSLNDLRIVKVSGNTCLTALSGSTSVITPTASGVFGTYANGYYVEFQTSSFSTFFITSAISSATLPLHLLFFDGSLKEKSVGLTWRTTAEVGVKEYGVERSADGRSFASVGTVAAKNNTAQNDYAFTDLSPLQGLSYYRLKMQDKDGSFGYSRVITISNRQDNALQLAPNPVRNTLMVNHAKAVAGAVVQIVSADGKKLLSQKVTAGTVQTTVDVSLLPSGVYRLLYINQQVNATANFLKQ